MESSSWFTKSKRSGKKRPRGFKGTPSYLVPPVDPGPEQLPAESPESYALPSASKRKLVEEPTISGVPCGSMLLRPRPTCDISSTEPGCVSEADNREMRGNRIVRCQDVLSLLGELRHCSKHTLSVSEDWSLQRGLVTRIVVRCSCGWFQYLADSYNSEQILLNVQSVLAMRMVGKGISSLEMFTAIMDLPPPVGTKSYRKAVYRLLAASRDSVQAEYLASANQLHAMCADGTLFVPQLLVEVSNDGDDHDSEDEDESGDSDSGDSDSDESDDQSVDESPDSEDVSDTSDDDESPSDPHT